MVTLSGKDHYLGPHGSPESRAEYDRLVAEWLRDGRHRRISAPPESSDLTINELLVRFLKWAELYYRKDGKPTGEATTIRLAVRQLRQLYGHTLAREFGPKSLKTVQQAMVDADLCRNEVNRRVRTIRRVFKWGVAEELVPAPVHHALTAVTGLRRGRGDVRESKPVRPVAEAFVDAVQPFVPRQVWAMIQLQLLTGARPGEVVIMRTRDLDTSGKVWVYTPASHKTEHHGRERRIYLGPQAQEVAREWLRAELDKPMFSPAEATAERVATMRSRRKSPVQPSQKNRAKRRPKKKPGDAYTVDSYRRAITYGIGKANRERVANGEPEIPSWHPHQLRHNAATRLRREFGLDAARAVLGHASADMTEVYAERDEAVAMGAALRVG